MKFRALPLVVLASVLHARVDLLLVPPAHAVSGQPGVELTLYLNNPTEVVETAHLPSVFIASYASRTGRGHVRLELVNPHDAERQVPAMSRETILLRLAEPIPAAGGFCVAATHRS